MKSIIERPRLSVARSNKYIYAQIIDDKSAKTLVAANGLLKTAENVGATLAKRAISKKIKEVTFDRRRYKYHGHIEALAEAARKGGLIF